MNTNDKDWIELIAGREVDGFTEKEKLFFSNVREALVEDDFNDFECSKEELAKDKEKIMQKWDEHFEKKTNVTHFPAAKKKNTHSKVFGIPLAIAASVAVVAITLTLRDPYPDISPGFNLNNAGTGSIIRGNEDISKYDLVLTLKNTSPKKVRKQLKEFFSTNDVQYVFREIQNGWEVDFIVSPKKVSIINTQFSKYGLNIVQHGFINLKIINK